MPLHDRIPREIFETILHLCVGFKTPVYDLENLQLVCRSWRDIVAEASFLWSTITTLEGPGVFHKALRMVKGSLLDIIFIELVHGDVQAKDFFSLTGEKIDQWRSLEIQASEDMEEALAFIQTQNLPPKLEILHVQYGWDTPETADAVLFRGTPAIGLKHVELTRAPINVRPLRLSGLKSLILRQVPSITAADIATILANSPTLKTICLAQLKDAVLPTKPATGKPNYSFHSPIQLPFLIELKLDGLPFPFFGFLLWNLVVPQLRILEVIAKQPIAQLLATDKSHLNTTLTSVTSGAREYAIRLYGGYEIIIGGLCIILTLPSLRGSMDDFRGTFDQLSEHLGGLALEDLPLRLRFEYCEPGFSDLEWFTHRTNVNGLTLFNEPSRTQHMMDVIPLLGRPTSGPPPIWLLPQLEVFRIDLVSTEIRGLIVDMLKARHAVLPDSFPGERRASPKHLKEVWLFHFSEYPMSSPLEEFLAEFAQAVKGADVYWAGRGSGRGGRKPIRYADLVSGIHYK
ncbi:hypothetical protein FS837_004387 [Tulasnella sp. UAMH 9824]|nr:hypothetical protein FS837_004387 [Tulasnella sp. UAMH 9824]